ncbi:DUF4199 domain-containing protein [Maribacter spongiicola]|uniref:DUF4199 domain-containing protein n=1 Tax=Maribacter spongiicola TaxID=1206753 RepID=UPI003F95F152
MEENEPKTGKYALKYGIILGVIGIVLSLMLFSQDLHYQIDLKRLFINLLLSLTFIVVGGSLAMIEFRKVNNDFISFRQGLKIGVGVALVSGIIGILFNFILTEIIDPETTEKAINYASEMMLDAGMSKNDVDKAMEDQKNQNPIKQLGMGLIFSIILGFIGSIIPALIIKKQENLN